MVPWNEIRNKLPKQDDNQYPDMTGRVARMIGAGAER